MPGLEVAGDSPSPRKGKPFPQLSAKYSASDPAAHRSVLRFVSASAAGQHSTKREKGFIYADAVEEAAIFLGVSDGVSGVQKLGIPPDALPKELLAQCREVLERKLEEGLTLDGLADGGDGHWVLGLLREAYDATTSDGATTLLVVVMEDIHRIVVAGVGDCGLLHLRPVANKPLRLSAQFRTRPLRYEANKPKQIARLPSANIDNVHMVIAGARLDTVPCKHGDILILGSDGIFDNLSDEEILKIVQETCEQKALPAENSKDECQVPAGQLAVPWVSQLEAAARALVSAAIQNADTGGSPDDTTALVAAVVEVEDAAEFDFQSSRATRRRRRPSTEDTGALNSLLNLPECCRPSADEGDEIVTDRHQQGMDRHQQGMEDEKELGPCADNGCSVS